MSRDRMGNIFGVDKISKYFIGVLEIPDISWR